MSYKPHHSLSDRNVALSMRKRLPVWSSFGTLRAQDRIGIFVSCFCFWRSRISPIHLIAVNICSPSSPMSSPFVRSIVASRFLIRALSMVEAFWNVRSQAAKRQKENSQMWNVWFACPSSRLALKGREPDSSGAGCRTFSADPDNGTCPDVSRLAVLLSGFAARKLI